MEQEDNCIRCGKNFSVFSPQRSHMSRGGQVNVCTKCVTPEEVTSRQSSEVTTNPSLSGQASNTIQPSTSSMRTTKLPISTTNEIPLQQIVKYVGLVRSGTVRAKHAGSDFFAGLKNIVGGEIKGCTSPLADAPEEAIHRME